jgi:hypothetical protein
MDPWREVRAVLVKAFHAANRPCGSLAALQQGATAGVSPSLAHITSKLLSSQFAEPQQVGRPPNN